LAGQVTVGKLGDQNDPANLNQEGDLPTKRKDGKLGWDGDTFDIYSTEDGKDKYISARGDVHFHAGSNSEYWLVVWDNDKKQYVVKVFSEDMHANPNAQCKETFYVDDMTNLKISFDIDPSHIQFDDNADGSANLADPSDPDQHKINNADPHGKKLSFDAGQGTAATDSKNPNPDPDVPSKDGGKTLTYNSKADPSFTNYFDDPNATDGDDTVKYEITASGKVTLTPAAQDDHFTVTKSTDGQWYTVTAEGSDSSGNKKKIIYQIDATKVSNIEFDNIDPKSSVDLSALSDDDKAKFVTADGKPIEDAQGAQLGSDALPDNIKNLLKATGATFDKFIAAYKNHYPNDFAHADTNGDGNVDPQEFADALKHGLIQPFPPSDWNENTMNPLFALLGDLDGQFSDAMSTVQNAYFGPKKEGDDWRTGDAAGPAIEGLSQAGPRLAVLLGKLYPDKTFTAPDYSHGPAVQNCINWKDSQGHQGGFTFTKSWWGDDVPGVYITNSLDFIGFDHQV
jgi:hypothetical protein